jgi:sigma-B regulation protein RsbU (phosphoserine phosphatase)
MEGGMAKVISHPLQEILSIQNPPFPIDIQFEPIENQWTEEFPIPNTKLTLSLGTSDERIYELQTGRILLRIATFLLLVLFLGGGLMVFFVRRLEKPFKELCLTMQQIAEGATHCRYKPQPWGFEVNSIGSALNEMLDEMLAHAQATVTERIEREKLAQELKLGHEIQGNLFPKHFPVNQNFTITAGCIPALEVGGDFYDVFPLQSGRTLIAVADLAGKGIGACLFALGLRSSLRALAANIESLSEIVQKANELFLTDAEESSQFATLWIGILENNKLSFLSLGHPPALLKRDQTLQELTTPYPAIGAMPYGSIQVRTVQLQPGDELLVYSDGATEAMDKEEKLYGLDRLKEVFLRCDRNSGANDVLKQVQIFSQSVIQRDDLTLLYLRFL